jgi:hypothetical protein
MRNKAVIAFVLAILSTGCPQRLERKVGPTLQTVDMEAPYLKCHMKSGEMYVLTAWRIDEATKSIVGSGELHGTDRRIESRSSYRVPFADVALYETNTVITSPAVAGLAVIAGLSAIVTTACIVEPKNCFGSCPTFYAPDDHGGRPVLQAEGFSDAISPALESNDIDSLWRTTGRPGPFTLTMTNEAYETHVVKAADLLAVPRPRGGRVLGDGTTLWSASRVIQPTSCTAAEGDCLASVRLVDTDERSSLTDENDLAARETIDLAFPATGTSQQALVVGARQSLVTTFLLYQGLAYLGTTATSWLALLERGDTSARKGGRVLQKLGSIEVQIERDGAWQTVGTIYETGPIATDVHLVMLPPGVSGERVRLTLPRGGWRIDSIALATITGKAAPIRLAPKAMRGTISSHYNAGRKATTTFPIVTMPGDRYELDYTLPKLPSSADEYELFLDSRGYYLEWMRKEWLKEENPVAALRMFVTPEQMLKELAPAYKKLEPKAEELFWRSRYAHP